MEDQKKTKAQLISELEAMRARLAELEDVEAERIYAEKNASENADRMSKIVTHSNEVFYIHNTKHQLSYVSPQSIEIFGYTPDEMLVNWTTLVTDNSINEKGFGLTEKAIQTGEKQAPYVLEIKRKDGGIRFVEVDETPIEDEDGKVVAIIGALRDITEWIRTKELIEFEKIQLLSIFDSIDDIIYVVDLETYQILYVNKAIPDKSQDELIGGICYKELRGFDSPCEFCTNRTIQEQKPERYKWEYHNSKFDKDFVVTSRIVKWPDGRDVRIVLAVDITEQKEVETKIRQSRENQRVLLDNIPTQVWYLTDDHTYGAVNKSHADFIGVRIEELAFRDFFDIYPKEIIETHQKENAEVFKTGRKITVELWLPDASGERRLLSVVKSPKRDEEGNVEYIICSAEDITERAQVEEALRQSEERYKRLSEVTGEGIVFHDKGLIFDANASFAKMFGYELDELIGKNTLDILFIPESKERVLENIARGMEGTYQLICRKKDATLFPVEVRVRETYYQGKLVRVASLVDISERKQAEAEILHQISELEVLYENGLALSGLLDKKKIARRTIDVLNQKLEWHHIAIRLYHPESNELELLALNEPGMDKEKMQEHIERLNRKISTLEHGLSGWVIKHKKTVRIDNLAKDSRYVATYSNLESGLYVPLMVGDDAVGSIAVESRRKEAFSPQDERLLLTLANQAAISLENAQLYQELQHELAERSFAEEQLVKLNAELEKRVASRTAEIESAHRRLELATAVAGFGVWERTIDVDVEIWDEQMHKIYGTSAETFKPSYENWLKLVHPSDRGRVKETIDKALREQLPYSTEYKIIRPDGSIRQISARAVILFDKENNIPKIVGANIDVTTTKQAEGTLRLANTELERALRVKDEFLANMSHELRTPLNAILGLSESLLEQIAGPLNAKQQRYLRTISESGHHLLDMINDILDLAKIEAGQVVLDIGKVSIRQVCQASVRMVKQQAQKKEQNITIDIDDGIGMLWADERRLKQMIVNLLSNAVKFTPVGGSLGIKVEIRRANNAILIKVWDTGIGINLEDQQHLFKPFVQLDSGLARENVGTGLGLALISQLVRLHGGHLNVDSTPNQGSCFTISLLWKPAKQTGHLPFFQERSERASVVSEMGKGKTILVVEDTDEVVMMIKDYLESRDYHIEVAKNGSEAISLAKSTHPNLILMDVMMPVMDGLTATRKIKSDPTLYEIPIIGMTALAMQKDRENCLNAGMDDYLSKPVELKTLLIMIRQYLAEKEE